MTFLTRSEYSYIDKIVVQAKYCVYLNVKRSSTELPYIDRFVLV